MSSSGSSKQNIVLSPIAALPPESDLTDLIRYWRGQGLPHRIVEESGMQVLYALEDRSAQMIDELKRFQSGEMQVELRNGVAATGVSGAYKASEILSFIKNVPVTLCMVMLSILGFFVGSYQFQPFFDLMVIQTVDTSGVAQWLGLPIRISIEEFLSHGHYWRLLTPIFLHFGWVHIVFNMLWLWELGRRIEKSVGSIHLLMIIIFIGVASNLWQAESTPLADFGGMSGVIYGLLGYCGVFYLLLKDHRFELPKAVYVIMLGSLLLGYSGLLDHFVLMANTAHLMGLVFGFVIAIPSALMFKFRS